MGTADRIERERQEKRARILDAARELFLERGIEAVTLREIAQKIEYSTTAIYVHFKDKASLVQAMVTEDFATFATTLERAAHVADPVERLYALHVAYLEFAFEMPRHYQLLFLTPAKQIAQGRAPEAAPAPAVEGPPGINGYRALLATVRECIATGRFRPGLTDPDEVAQVIWGNVHGLVSLLIVMGDHEMFHWRSRERLARTSYETILRGLLRDPDAASVPGARPRGTRGRKS